MNNDRSGPETQEEFQLRIMAPMPPLWQAEIEKSRADQAQFEKTHMDKANAEKKAQFEKVKAADKQAADKRVTLIDVLREAEVEQVANAKAQDLTGDAEAGVDDTTLKENKPGFFAKVGSSLKHEVYDKPAASMGRHKKSLIAALAVTIICLVGAVVALSIVTVDGSKHASRSVAARGSLAVDRAPVTRVRELRDGLSAFTAVGDNPTVVTSSDTCDDETPVLSSVSTMNNYNSTSTTLMGAPPIMVTSVDVLTEVRPTVSTFLGASAMVPQITSSSSSSSVSTSSITETCLEYGDGAGPCARPYGHPNFTPSSWLSMVAAESQGKASFATVPAIVSTTPLPIGVPVGTSPNSSSGLDASECQLTTTVYVTIAATPSADSVTVMDAPANTIYGTATEVSDTLTVTLRGPDGPATTTETPVLGTTINGTAVVTAINGTGAPTTLSLANFTLSLTSFAAANGTAFTGTGAMPTASPDVSGGEKQASVPKPLGMGGSSSGNGMYCAVMLVALAALLI